MKDVLIPAALKDKQGLAIVRVGPYLPLQQTRHLAVIVPKSTQDLDILLKEIENQSDGRSILNPFRDMVGQTLANNTGEFAKEELRKLVPFTRNTALFNSIIKNKFKEALQKLSTQEESFVLLDTMKLLTRQVAVAAIIGPTHPFTSEENDTLNSAFKSIKGKLLSPFSFSKEREFRTGIKTYQEASEQFAQKHLSEIKDGLKSPGKNILSDLIREEASGTDSDQSMLTKSQHSMLITGVADGVYINIVGILLQLINHPEVIQKLREELDAQCTIDESGYKAIDYANTAHTKTYLDDVIKEGLRYISSAPAIPRYTSTGLTKGNIKIPPFTTILIKLDTLHHDKTFWGEDAHLFNPERWSRDNIQAIRDFKHEHYLPFFTGPRPCPGSKVGLLLLKTFISELFLNYDLIPDPHQAEPIVDTKAALVMDIGPGYRVSVREREMPQNQNKESLKKRN